MKKFSLPLAAVLILTVCAACHTSIPDGYYTSETVSETATAPEPVIPEPISEAEEYLYANYSAADIDGSTSMTPLHTALNKKFGGGYVAYHQKTVWAFNRLADGDNVVLLSVDYSDELLEKARNAGVDLVKRPITKEAFVFLINKNNPVKSLTIEQIKGIYSGKITNWKEVGGDNAEIKAFQRNADSGSQIRMVKFMGDTELMEADAEYYAGDMGGIIRAIEEYDTGRYSIAYNMYTFTEKQYPSEEVVLLDVDGVHPTDETVFDGTYPLVIYNNIFYDRNNALASEFAENLYAYLMSNNGQKLIADAGYVNLNGGERDKIGLYDPGYDDDLLHQTYISEYDPAKGEFYDVDGNGGLTTYYSFADYLLPDSAQKNNEKARAFINSLDFMEFGYSDSCWIFYTARRTSTDKAVVYSHYNPVAFEEIDVFKFRYNGKYYYSLEYLYDGDKILLSPDSDQTEYLSDVFSEYIPNIAEEPIEITMSELSSVEVCKGYVFNENGLILSIEYCTPFKTD